MNASVNVELQVACRTETIPHEDDIRAWIEDTLRLSPNVAAGEFEVVVRVVDERESRALNYRFRQTDKPTNVLAFPSVEAAEIAELPEPASMPLGDLALCAPVLEREARQQGKSPAAHWGHLLVHGTLHLLGYDHQNEDEAAQMERLEAGILAARGVADPYA
ncbi:MAG TPA: rRNA maturation RNase YbeY [Woeseiaceae bacterium]|nr:rRNA maturation RNase YbeY [Woeseiaceae bacterium]